MSVTTVSINWWAVLASGVCLSGYGLMILAYLFGEQFLEKLQKRADRKSPTIETLEFDLENPVIVTKDEIFWSVSVRNSGRWRFKSLDVIFGVCPRSKERATDIYRTERVLTIGDLSNLGPGDTSSYAGRYRIKDPGSYVVFVRNVTWESNSWLFGKRGEVSYGDASNSIQCVLGPSDHKPLQIMN